MSPRGRLLLVDDSVSYLEVMSAHLDLHHEVRLAQSGEEALHLLTQGEPPDLVLMDVSMPGLDGFEVLQRMRRQPRLSEVPVIFITASGDTEAELRALASGGADFLSKPVCREVLLGRVELQLRLLEQRQRLEGLNQQLKIFLDEVDTARQRLQVLATAQAHSPTAFVVLSPLGVIEHANPAFGVLLGQPSEAIEGRWFADLCDTAPDSPPLAALQQALQLGQGWEGELGFRQPGPPPQRRQVLAGLVPVLGRSGALERFVCSLSDITALRAAEDAVRERRDEEIRLSATIQRHLLQGVMPARWAGCSIALASEPTQVLDGDFRGFMPLDDTRCEVFFGDVMGKGITAAMAGAAVKGAYHRTWNELWLGQRGQLPDVADVVNGLNARISPELAELGVFVTLVVLRIDLQARTCTMVNAGHTPLLHLRGGATTTVSTSSQHLPLGVVVDEVFSAQTLPLSGGDLLAVYSDGLTDATDASGHFFGEAPLVQALQDGAQARRAPQAIVDGLMTQWHRFRAPGERTDDTSLLVLQLPPRTAADAPSADDTHFAACGEALSDFRGWLAERWPGNGPSVGHRWAHALAVAEAAFTGLTARLPGAGGPHRVHARLVRTQGQLHLDLDLHLQGPGPDAPTAYQRVPLRLHAIEP